jgi:divalent metal cation (Fe/Co/Zn/Cd) transporter
MSNLRRRLASLVTALIFGFILWRILERIFIHIWVQTPWWGLLIMLVVLFLIIDYAVGKAFGTKE